VGPRNYTGSRVRLGLIALALCVAGTAAAPGSASGAVFFTEYIEGTSNNKALEIANTGDTSVDLAAGSYSIRTFFNGNASPTTTALTGVIPPHDVFVIANSNAGAGIIGLADQTAQGAITFNGNDAVELQAAGATLDVIGQIGVDPSPPGYWGTEPTTTLDHTLRRNSAILVGDTNGADAFDPAIQWTAFPTDDASNLGGHTFADSDGDGVTDDVDNCLSTANATQANHDGDGEGDVCDIDDDNDGRSDGTDLCPQGGTGAGGDTDSDGCKDTEDADDDNDGITDASPDNCQLVANPDQANHESDAQGDACDSDDDNDGTNDTADACAAGATGAGGDIDGDGCKAAEDTDDDGDGVFDTQDACSVVAGTKSGCPASTRRLTLQRASRRKLKGTLAAPGIPGCRASQKLNLMRKTGRGARKVKTVTTAGNGSFAAAGLAPGRYFVKAPSRLIANVGFCSAATSKIVRLP